jgi:hypothetical protein
LALPRRAAHDLAHQPAEMHMIRLSSALLLAAGSIASIGIARAEEPPLPPEPPKPVVEISPVTIGKGKIVIAGSTVNINLSDGAFGEPVSFAPAVWYGLQEKLTLGLTHDFGTTPWTPRPTFRRVPTQLMPGGPIGTTAGGMGICVTGSDSGCPRPYDNVGLDVLQALKVSKLSIALHPGLDIGSFDPFSLDIRIGMLGHYKVNDKIEIYFDPRLQFGLTERNTNKDGIDLPVWGWYAVNDKIRAYVHTGMNGTFEDFGDSFSIPLQLGGNYQVNEKLSAGLDFAFLKLNDGVDARALGLRALYAL